MASADRGLVMVAGTCVELKGEGLKGGGPKD